MMKLGAALLAAVASAADPPTAGSLAAEWQAAYDPPTRACPIIGNFAGGVGASREDVAAVDSFFATPFAQGMPELWSMTCLLYTSPSPRDQRGSRMPSSA